MTDTSMIGKVLMDCAENRFSQYLYFSETDAKSKLATELRALLAERDALKTKAQPVRKLREYYSETIKTSYRVRDGVLEVRHNEGGWDAPAAINVKDVSAVADLMCDPYEPVETVEAVVVSFANAVNSGAIPTRDVVAHYATRLRAAVAAEGVRDV